MLRLFCVDLFFITPSVGAFRKTVLCDCTFPGYLHLYFRDTEAEMNKPSFSFHAI